MNYILSGIELHPDKGFGITADAYYKSAEHLFTNRFEHYDVTQQAEMPQNFLYRHSIELYLKSLIIIFHRKLKISYGTAPFDSDQPEVFVNGSWMKLYNCHHIGTLYDYWLKKLLLPNVTALAERASKGDWVEYERVTELFKVICKYDEDSAYFRYPITKNSALDHKKHTMQKFKAPNLDTFIKDLQGGKSTANNGKFTMLVLDDNENIVSAFKQTENVLSDVREALKEVAHYFHCIHIMTRVTLCGGM